MSILIGPIMVALAKVTIGKVARRHGMVKSRTVSGTDFSHVRINIPRRYRSTTSQVGTTVSGTAASSVVINTW